MAPRGRKPLAPLIKARRAAAAAIKRRNELHELIKAEQANPSPPKPRKIGKQPVPLPEQWRRLKETAHQAIESLHHEEKNAGEKPSTEAALLRWLAENDFSAGTGRPSLGKLGELFKELRRKTAKMHEIVEIPAAEYDQKYKHWLSADGKKGRQPQTRRQRIRELKQQIRDIEAQIDALRADMDPGENMKVELDQLRIRRRNLILLVNQRLGIRATDVDAKQRQESFLKTSRAQLRDKILDIDTHISELTRHIQTHYPKLLKNTRTFLEIQTERDLLLETVTALLQKADPSLRRRILRQLKQSSEKVPRLLAELENLQNA